MAHKDIPSVNKFGLKDLKGQKLGFLHVIEKARTIKGQRRWRCICVCGTVIIVKHRALLHTNSPKVHCGCKTRGGLPSQYVREYHIWNMMHRRCKNPNHVGYMRYGGSGITVEAVWDTFEGFMKDMGPAPSLAHTLDRKRPLENYGPDNCRWATAKEQARNKKMSIYMPHPDGSGRMIPAAEAAELSGMNYHAFRLKAIMDGRWPTYMQNPPPGSLGPGFIAMQKRAEQEAAIAALADQELEEEHDDVEDTGEDVDEPDHA